MDIDLKDHSLEIHIAIADAKIQGIVFGQGYNPDVYNDLVTQTLAAFRQALTIAVEHGYTFPTDNEDEDDDGDGD